MYGYTARQSILAILKDAPELRDLRTIVRKDAKDGYKLKRISDARLRKLTDRIVSELWFRGFAVSARAGDLPPPKLGVDHDGWRATKKRDKASGHTLKGAPALRWEINTERPEPGSGPDYAVRHFDE